MIGDELEEAPHAAVPAEVRTAVVEALAAVAAARDYGVGAGRVELGHLDAERAVAKLVGAVVRNHSAAPAAAEGEVTRVLRLAKLDPECGQHVARRLRRAAAARDLARIVEGDRAQCAAYADPAACEVLGEKLGDVQDPERQRAAEH